MLFLILIHLLKFTFIRCLLSLTLDNSVCKDRSSHQRYSIIKDVLRDFAKFTGRQLCQSLFFNKLQALEKETLAQGLFSCEFCEISNNTFFIEHLQVTASVKVKTELTKFQQLMLIFHRQKYVQTSFYCCLYQFDVLQLEEDSKAAVRKYKFYNIHRETPQTSIQSGFLYSQKSRKC